jgi:N-acetylmuramoyl-L-alanine amidase
LNIELKKWKDALLCLGGYARARPFIVLVWLAWSPMLGVAEVMPDQIAYEFSTRYTPYADGAALLDFEQIATKTLADAETAFDRPLTELHLALDPGHIGGIWAAWEWREFRISNEDHWVREGELVLEVARRIRTRLTRLGAKVTLLREDCQPINPKTFIDYWSLAAAEEIPPTELTLKAQLGHALALSNRAIRLAIVRGEIAERARLVNEVIQPDALISLHINAAAWPDGGREQLVDSDHAHVLIFGCLSEAELASPRQQLRLVEKLSNSSGAVEARLGAALGSALIEATGLPASDYQGRNAIRIDPEVPSLWARNLMLLRLVDCPTVLMEPYISNSHSSYARIQNALSAREYHEPLPADDILVEYADAVVTGVLRAYQRD